jgi:hypothetical protein
MEIKSDKTKSDIISVVKVLLSVTDGERDSLFEALLENAYAFAKDFTRAEEIPSPLLARMVCEDFARGNGVSKVSRGGMSEEYLDGYSVPVISFLRGLRRLRAI